MQRACHTERQPLVARLWRLVRPGGRLLVATKGEPYLAPLYDSFYSAARAAALDLQPPQPWQRTQTPDQLRAVFDTARVPAGISQQTVTVPLREPADWWRRFAEADGETRQAMLEPEQAPRRKRRRRKTKVASPDVAPAQ